MIGRYYTQHGMPELAEHAVRHNLLEYTELILFLLLAMSYVNIAVMFAVLTMSPDMPTGQ